MQILWDTRPHITNYLVPDLSNDDSEDALIEAAGLYEDNVFAQRTRDIIDSNRPEIYDPELAGQLIERISPSGDHFSIKFYGADPIRVERQGNSRNTIKGRRLKRS